MSTTHSSSDSTRLFAVLESAAWLYSARIVEVLVRVVYVIVLARFLGSADYGLFSYGQSFYLSLLIFGSLGGNVMLAQAASRGSSELSQMMKQTLALRLVVVTLTICIFLCSIWGLHDSWRVRTILGVLSFALIGRGLYFWSHEVFIVVGRSRVVLLLNLFWRPVELGLVICLLLGGAGLFMVAITHSLIWCAEAALALMLIQRIPLPIHPLWNLRPLAMLFRRGLPLGLLSGITNFLMIGPLLFYPHLASNPEGLGQLAVVLNALFVFSSIGWSIGFAALPALSREQEFGTFTKRYAELVSKVGWLLGIVLTVFWMEFGPMVILYLLGPDYVMAGDLMGLTMVALAPLIWGATLSHVLLARNYHLTALVCALAGAGGVSVAAFLLIPAYGVFGGVVALLLGVFLWTIAIIGVLLRTGCLNVYKTMLRPACVAISVVVGYGLLNESYPIISLCVAMLILMVTTVAFGVFSREERLWLIKRLSTKCLDEKGREV
ncbi:MAG: oligosaccharide flippase family protein [Desulfocapsa sp.]|nr:oligosaccharide flippase family protein [Desulfocapsa sp.]